MASRFVVASLFLLLAVSAPCLAAEPAALDMPQLQKSAEQGDIRAQTRLGNAYAFGGQGVKESFLAAVRWWRRAAEQGDAEAQYYMAFAYLLGIGGLTRDYEEVLAWLRKSAEQDYIPAQYYISILYSKGGAALLREPENLQWYNKAVQNAPASVQRPKNQEELQQVYTEHLKQGESFTEAIFAPLGQDIPHGMPLTVKDQVICWEKAAEQGEANAQLEIGNAIQRGFQHKPGDLVQAVQWWRKAAERQNTEAMLNLAYAYATEGVYAYASGSKGLVKDQAESTAWFEKAAEAGSVIGASKLAQEHYKGNLVAKDETKALYWYRRAAEKAYADTSGGIAWSLYAGKDNPEDQAINVGWWRKAAEQGNYFAVYYLGWAYTSGYGVKPDYTEAIKYIRRAVDQAKNTLIIAPAMANIAAAYQYGLAGLPKSEAEAAVWWKKSAERTRYSIHESLPIGKYYAELMTANRQRAEEGAAAAQSIYASSFLYENAQSGMPVDKAEAMRWMEKSAAQGYADAQYRLAEMQWKNRKMAPQDGVKAINVFRQLIDSADIVSQRYALNILAEAYETGDVVEKDEKQAVIFWRRLAEQGNLEGFHQIGMAYKNGWGSLPQDNIAAYKWLQLAANCERSVDYGPEIDATRGLFKEIKKALHELEQRMTTQQLGEARLQALAWRPVPRNNIEALNGFKHLARRGNKHARDTLAYLESDSEFGAPDTRPEAIKWWERLANAGDPLGQVRTGLFYRDGRGIPKNGVVADMWLFLASEHGYTATHSPDLSAMAAMQIAKDARSDLEKTLSPEQIADAQKRAAAWHSARSSKN